MCESYVLLSYNGKDNLHSSGQDGHFQKKCLYIIFKKSMSNDPTCISSTEAVLASVEEMQVG